MCVHGDSMLEKVFFFLQRGEFGLLETLESDCIHVAGLVVGDYCEEWSHWEGTHSLSQWMQDQGVPGICGKLSPFHLLSAITCFIESPFTFLID